MSDDVKGFRERITAAMERIAAGHSPMRIPADMTDPDIVLSDCLARIEGEASRSAAAVAAAVEKAEGHAEDARQFFIKELELRLAAEAEAERDALRAQVDKLRTDIANADAAYAGDVSAQRVRAERAEAQVDAARALCAYNSETLARDVLAAMDGAKP